MFKKSVPLFNYFDQISFWKMSFQARMTMLDERFLSVGELQERQQELQHQIEKLE